MMSIRGFCKWGLVAGLLGGVLGASGDTKGTLQSIRAKKSAAARPRAQAPAPRKTAPRTPSPVKRATAAVRKTIAPAAVGPKPVVSKPVAVAPVPEDSLAQGRVAWWPMEGDARDIVGGNDGQLRRGITAVPGTRGVALQFDGNKSGINIPDSLPLQFDDSFSVSLWVTVFTFPAEGHSLQLFFRGDARAGLDPYCVYLNGLGQLGFLIDSGTARTRVHARPPLRVPTHISATLNTATQQMRVYMNGKLVDETKTADRPFRKLDPRERPGIAIGNTQNSGEHEQAFYGVLDELQVHSRALTPEEVGRLAQP